MKCADCRFHSITGQCRKNPPQPFGVPVPSSVGGMEMKVVSVWPMSQDHQWCGAFEAGKAIEEAPPDNGKVTRMIQGVGH